MFVVCSCVMVGVGVYISPPLVPITLLPSLPHATTVGFIILGGKYDVVRKRTNAATWVCLLSLCLVRVHCLSWFHFYLSFLSVFLYKS